ncbi:MAG: hypothetical protein VYC34_02230, partial [Planctomycetota bacterium]|nr:hypothetical protein [Planctomycetota bacterium]
MAQHTNPSQTRERLPRRRTAAGGPHASLLRARAGRFSAAALGLGAMWLGYSVVRPLPPVDSSAGEFAAWRAPALDDGESLDLREQRLAVVGADNLFNPERSFWTADVKPADGSGAIASGAAAEAVDGESASPRRPLAGPATAPDDGDGYDDIVVARGNQLPPVLSKELKELRLRGVYRGSDGPVAMIGHVSEAARLASEPRRVGDTFDDGAWQLIAIDERGSRVILRRNDEVNVELRLFEDRIADATSRQAAPAAGEEGASSGEAVSSAPQPTPADKLAEVRRMLESVEGIPAADVDEVLRLAQEDPEAVEAERQAEAESALAAAEAGSDAEGANAEESAEKSETRKPPAGVGALL